MDNILIHTIKLFFITKINNGIIWNNEFGICNVNTNSHIKFIFKGYGDFNIELLYQNGRIFFKIIPHILCFLMDNIIGNTRMVN